ncbi:MAG: acetamidase/formamidase family protein [Bacteroidales bacterium]|nr:acetamidase/formamidase family protein [Bacteroidales bacterium]
MKRSLTINYLVLFLMIVPFILSACTVENSREEDEGAAYTIDYSLGRDQTHNKFSSLIKPVLVVEDGAVIEAFTEEAADEQIKPGMTAAEFADLEDYDPGLVHPLTGPVFVEGAMPGDILQVKLHVVEIGEWGWTRIVNGIFLEEEFEPLLRTYELSKDMQSISFAEGITVPFDPFPGVMGVAPAAGEMLSTIPPRANGGNMDDPHMTQGTILYFPVFVEGALFSIGDMHAAQGAGEVCGTAIEVPGRVVYELNVIKEGPNIKEPQYETPTTYAVTAFAPTLDEAARKANSYMIDYLEDVHGMSRSEAYMLTSLAGDLRIAEVVDQNMMVTMHIAKSVFSE